MIPSGLRKFTQLVRLLPQHPGEFWDRVSTVVEVRRENCAPPRYRPVQFQDAVKLLQQALGRDLAPILRESALVDIEKQLVVRTESLSQVAPFGLFHNGDFALARFCYLACRALQPRVALETGVAYGVTTSFVLKAMAQQGTGELLSIDLPPLGSAADSFVGFLVPEELRSRWRLYRGQSKRVLPALLRNLESVDLFIHDSLHTYRNMTWEFKEAWSRLRKGGLLISDDVNQNCAFDDFVEEVSPLFWAVVKETSKNAAFGIARKAL